MLIGEGSGASTEALMLHVRYDFSGNITYDGISDDGLSGKGSDSDGDSGYD